MSNITKEEYLKIKQYTPCILEDCPIGLFLSNKYNELCLKSEYGLDSYIVSSGEMFWGGAKTKDELRKVIVTPCELEYASSNNLPLKFEELEVGMWVWDNYHKCYSKVGLIYNYNKVYLTPIDYYTMFEENRFYRREVENNDWQ